MTDSGLEHLSQISTLEGLGLRGMSITDAACETMATKMRLIEINMPRCPEVTAKGLLRLAHCETIESLGFSVGTMSQDDLIRLVSTAAPQLGRIDIEMDPLVEATLDLPALRKAAKAKKIRLFAVRNRAVSAL